MRLAWLATLFLTFGLLGARPDAAPKQSQSFDWPQWQGPQRNAQSRETGLLQDWPKGGPPLAWKITGIGTGFSTPSIAAGRIFTMGNKDKTEYVFALAEADGKQLWQTPVGPERHKGGGYPGPRCTPTVDGDRVYALGLNGDLLCLDVQTGKEHWRKDLKKDFAGNPGGWGYTESPLIDGPKLLVTPGGKNTIVALDKLTGKLLWSGVVPQGDRAAYSSIIKADLAGKPQYVQFLAGGVVGLDAATGKFLWRYDAPANRTANISTPIAHGDHVFAASAYGTGGGLARITCTGDACDAEQVYFTNNMQNHHGGMVLLDGHLYGSNGNKLACLDFKTGTPQWQSKATGKGSITYADNRLYYRNEQGPIVLVEANPTNYVEHGRFDQPERSKARAWAHPVVANGKLYIADQDVLLVYDVKKK